MFYHRLLVVVLCWTSVHGFSGYYDDHYAYNVSGFLDEALEEYSVKVKINGNDRIQVEDPFVIGGFNLTNPTLCGLSSLKRIRDAWMVPLEDRKVVVYATLTFTKIQLSGEKLLGPGWDVDNPSIYVRETRITTQFISTSLRYDTTIWDGTFFAAGTCIPDTDLRLEKISSVILVMKDAEYSLDHWVEGLFSQIFKVFNPILKKHFERYFDLCQIMKAKGYRF